MLFAATNVSTFSFSHLPFPFLLRFNQLAHRVLDGDFGTEEGPLVRRDAGTILYQSSVSQNR